MKVSKIILGLFTVMILFAVSSVSAQKHGDRLPKCKANADQIYFVASGQSVTEVHPGSNGGNGYQLNIIGSGANKFELVKEPYMESVSLIPGYTNDTQAKWQVFFNPNMGREITNVKMRSQCTGRAEREYGLTVTVVLRDQ